MVSSDWPVRNMGCYGLEFYVRYTVLCMLTESVLLKDHNKFHK